MTLILNGTDNSATTPAVTGTDTDTGVYYPAANQVALATGGTLAMLANASQGVQFANAIGVGATTPTTSGAGITFPASQSASSNANTLDDYEEGTWTPRCGDGTTPITTVSKAVYTKVGKLVTIELDCIVNSPNPVVSNYITGLPFAGSTSGAGNGGGAIGYGSGAIVIGFHVTGATTTLYAWNLATSAEANLSGVRIIFSMSYTTSN